MKKISILIILITFLMINIASANNIHTFSYNSYFNNQTTTNNIHNNNQAFAYTSQESSINGTVHSNSVKITRPGYYSYIYSYQNGNNTVTNSGSVSININRNGNSISVTSKSSSSSYSSSSSGL